MRDNTRSIVPPARILSVDDDPVHREVLRVGLTRRGHEVRFAVHGAEALERLRAEEFDLVLMDVQMPVMDGVEATRRIRMLPPPMCDIPIVGLSADVLVTDVRTYILAGMNECLAKPLDWQRLADAIARCALRRETP